MKAHDKPILVIETRGGTVVGIYGRQGIAEVVLVDWDEFQDQGRPGVRYELEPISMMPADTRSLVDKAFGRHGRETS